MFHCMIAVVEQEWEQGGQLGAVPTGVRGARTNVQTRHCPSCLANTRQ